MAFTLSLDDFVISYFTSGNGFETLPIRIYGMTKKTVTPKMYALATIIFFVTYLEDLGEDTIAVLYPELGNFAEQYNKMAFRNLDSETLDYLNTLWENLKIN